MNFIRNILGFGNRGTRVFDISLERMQNSFKKMQEEAGWDVRKKMAWGYYFLDHDLKKLQEFGKKLEQVKLQIVETRKVEGDNFFLLHTEEQVVHTPDSLFEQCHILAELASSNHIEVFDGWDTGAIETKNIQ